MLCSAKSGGAPSWLDRLRFSKGFPATVSGDDIDRFLNDQNPSSPIRTSESTNPPPSCLPEPQRSDLAIVLSELFFIGGSVENSRLSGKKLPRKQANPRLCVGEIWKIEKKKKKVNTITAKTKKKKKKRRSDFGAKPPPPVNSDSNSLTPTGREIAADFDSCEEIEDDEEEMRGFSRSEVTVIDTSFDDWKTEKLVFRRKNVWRVRAKRGKSKSFDRKMKKKKLKNDDSNRSNNSDQSLKKPSLPQNDSREEDFREEIDTDSLDKLDQHFRKRPRFSNSPKKLKNGGSSSVAFVKGVSKPTLKQQKTA